MASVLSRERDRLQKPTGKELFHERTFPDGTVWTYFYRSGSDYLLRFPGLELPGDNPEMGSAIDEV